jgi:hypothetical protein
MKCSSVHPSELYHECRYHQGCTNPSCQVAIAFKFCVVAPNNCGSSVCNLVYVTLLAAWNLSWLPDLWNLYAPGHDHLLTYVSAVFFKILVKCLTSCLASFPNGQVSNHMTMARSFNGPVSSHVSVSLFPDNPVHPCLYHIALLYVV